MEFDGLRECAWVLRGRAIVCTGIAYKFRWEQCVSLWPRARAAAQLLLHTTNSSTIRTEAPPSTEIASVHQPASFQPVAEPSRLSGESTA